SRGAWKQACPVLRGPGHGNMTRLPDQWRANNLWSGSYFAGTVGGAPLSVVKQYTEQQNRPV
uniref:transposase n=1 Tax=Streptomyces sp. GbtcB7 TaxID=2824752 RepID=UPI0020C729E3